MAIILAVLYFGLIELLLIDSSRDLAEARRFRARVVAWTLAENAAERAAQGIAAMGPVSLPVMQTEDELGKMRGRLLKTDKTFHIVGEGETTGVNTAKSTVTVIGRVEAGGKIYIDYTMHSQ
ncbi:MAG TPA: hypothetical protein VHK90_11270 [Thermoanaerobaculia bacterium]|nr:hypothetical protein [Thermoanaerobaculia bacterium]